jgi:hypothetical protein
VARVFPEPHRTDRSLLGDPHWRHLNRRSTNNSTSGRAASVGAMSENRETGPRGTGSSP